MLESLICSNFATIIRDLEKYNKIKPCVWFHVRNEFTGKLDPRFGQRMKREGFKAGVADYVFLWDQGSGCIEFKTTKGILSEKQKLFKQDCQRANVNYVLARSVEEGMEALKEWGLM